MSRCKLKRIKTYIFVSPGQVNLELKLAWFFSLKFKKLLIKAITLALISSFALETACYGLATLLASQNPIAKRKILAALWGTQIRYAESEDAVRLLNANNAECLLLSSGKYLVTKGVAQNDLKLLRAIIREDIEAIMQVLADENRKNKDNKYQGIKELILRHFPPDENNDLPIDLYVNHTVARAFEWLILVQNGVILRNEIPKEETGFINRIEKIINANRHNYFTGEFWDLRTRREKIRTALNKGMVFYQVSGARKDENRIGSGKLPKDISPKEQIGYRKIVKTITIGDDALDIIVDEVINPALLSPQKCVEMETDDAEKAAAYADKELSKGAVGLITLAGGMSSRADLDYPKGLHAITPVTKKSLFETRAGELIAARDHYGKPIVWFIMTSDLTDEATRKYFKEKDYFGLGEENVIFIKQENVPAFEAGSQNLAMKGKDTVLNTPNGNGGLYNAMRNAGARSDGGSVSALDAAEQRGIKHFIYCQVDNPLPAINRSVLGYHIKRRSDFTSVVVRKRDAIEGLAMLVVDRKTRQKFFVEYNQPAALAIREKEGFEYGSIARFVFSYNFIKRTKQPPYKIIRNKKARLFKDRRIQDGLVDKLECFTIDTISDAKRSLNIIIPRGECFAPFKNPEGPDSPDTAAKAISDHWKMLIKRSLPDIEIPESTIIELPWAACFMTPGQLREKIISLEFVSCIKEDTALVIADGFPGVEAKDIRSDLPGHRAAGAPPGQKIYIEGKDGRIIIPTGLICDYLGLFGEQYPEIATVTKRIIDDLAALGGREVSIKDVRNLFPDSQGSDKRIAVTGPPYAGKSFFINDNLATGKYKNDIIWLPEVISVLRNAGIDYHNSDNSNRLIYILKYLLEREAALEHPNKVILCDRGLLDTFAYWLADKKQLEDELGGLEKQYTRYNAVMMFQGVASVPHAQNEFKKRDETTARAMEIEKTLLDIWQRHPKFHFIEHTDWASKNEHALKIFERIHADILEKESEALIDESLRMQRIVEISFWEDKERGVGIAEGMKHRALRRDIAYETGRKINRYLIVNANRISPHQIKRLEEIYSGFKKIARENSLFFLPKNPGVYNIKKEHLRSADVMGEEFLFFTLNSEYPFYSYPYQVTFSITPPGHRQEIHGHFFTKELTVSLGDGMFFEVYKIKDGRPEQIERVSVPRFYGTAYGVNTPHIIANNGTKPCPNITVKYDEGIHDRWNLRENPDETKYTFERGVQEPDVEHIGKCRQYSFRKEEIIYRIITIPPGEKYNVTLDENGEKGFFVVSGSPKAHNSAKERRAFASGEGDVIYIKQGKGMNPFIENGTDREVVIFSVDLAGANNREFAAKSLQRRFKALLTDIDGVLTEKGSRFLRPECIQKIITLLEKGVPVCINSGRNKFLSSSASPEESTHYSADEVVEEIRKELDKIGKAGLLANLYVASELGLVITNGYRNGDPELKAYGPMIDIDIVTPDRQEKILEALERRGLIKQNIFIERKDHSMAISDIPKDLKGAILRCITTVLGKEGILDKVDISVKKDSIYIMPKGATKKLALQFLVRQLGINEDQVAAFDDKADKDGSGHDIVDRPGGFAVDEADPDSKAMFDVTKMGNNMRGYKAFLWAVDRLNFTAIERVKPEELESAYSGILATQKFEAEERSRRWTADVLRRIGLNTAYVPRDEVIDYHALAESFDKAIAAGKTKDGRLTAADINFLKIYGTIFGKEYFTKGTISGYRNYSYRPDLVGPRVKAIIEECGLNPGSRVLDIGCAFGFYVSSFRQNGIEAEGMDISKYAIEQADSSIKKYLHLLDRLEALNRFPEKGYNLIILKDVLEHVPAELLFRFLNSIKRLGKKILVTVPVADERGYYINRDDEHDFTHVIKRDKAWWLSMLGPDAKIMDNIDTALKGNKAAGTLCVLLPIPEHLPADNTSRDLSMNVIRANMRNGGIENTEKMISVIMDAVAKFRSDRYSCIDIINICETLYKEIAGAAYFQDRDYADFLSYRLRSALQRVMAGEKGRDIIGGKDLLQRFTELCEKDVYGKEDEAVFNFIVKHFIINCDEADSEITYRDVRNVIGELFRAPDQPSSYISSKHNVSITKLKRIYFALRRSNIFQDLMSKKSPGAAMIRYYKGFIKDKERINGILNGTDNYPLVLEFHPSLACQNNCAICPNKDKHGYIKREGAHLLTEEQAKNILNEAKEHGVQEIVVSGGLEPLLSPISIFILDYSKKIGLSTVLITNGRSLSNKSLFPEVLKAARVRVSLLTSDPSTYNAITGSAESAYQELVNNIGELIKFRNEHKLNTKIGLFYPIVPVNYKDMMKFAAEAKNIGIDFVDFRHDLITNRGDKTLEWLGDLRQALLKFKVAIDSGEYKGMDITFSPYLNYIVENGVSSDMLEDSTAIKSPVCLARNFRVIINPYGEVYTCSMMAHPGLATDEYYVGTIPQSGELGAFLKKTSHKSMCLTPACRALCTNIDRMLINIQYKLAEDIKAGIGVEEQPYASGKSDNVVKIALMGTAMVRAEPVKKDDYFRSKIQKKFIQPPFGVYRLQHFLQQIFKEEVEAGRLRIDVFDPALATVEAGNSLDSIFERVRSEGYQVIGFSPIRVLLGEDLFFMKRVHEEASRSWAEPLYIAGGNEAALNSDVVFGTMPWLDFCIDGLGEPVLDHLVKRIFNKLAAGENPAKNNFMDMGGLIYTNDTGVTRNPCARINADTFRQYSAYAGENIPYDRYWAHNGSIGPVDTTFSGTTIETVRLFTRNFCPYNCAFCSQSVFGRKTYEGAPVSLTAEQIGKMIIDIYEQKGAKGIYFNDDDMFGNAENAKGILRKIIHMKQCGDIPAELRFYGQTRVDVIDEETLSLMREAGFVFLSFGVESFSDESLSAPDIKKRFTAKQAADAVKKSLAAKIPITNINLILFHPTIKRRAFITTVEETMVLLKESIRNRARLSVNSFPLIEAYAGAPINSIAEKNGWPKRVAKAEYDNKVWEYTESYLPIDEKMRKAVEDDNLMREFNLIMEKLTSDPRWPATTVSRSIGINSLVMFMAAYKLLDIGPNESAFTTKDMEDLIWELIKTFNPSVEQAASVLSKQGANVVFTFKDGKAFFRRGSMTIEGIPSEVMESLARKNAKEVLISLQSAKAEQVKDALQDAVFNDFSIEEAFLRHGIPAYTYPHFKKVLLVVPCGNYDGTPLKTVVPHPGIEVISHSLLRNPDTPDVDCRVFNPNLAGRDAIKDLISKESFDVIGFGFMPLTLRNDAPLIDTVALLSPRSILIAGGLNIDRLSHGDVFGKIPFDAFVAGPGEEMMARLVSKLPANRSEMPKEELVKRLTGVPNAYLYINGAVVKTKRVPFVYQETEEEKLREDIPYDRPDLTHGTTYNKKSQSVHGTVIPYDMVGTKRLYIKISDRCHGRCVFCSSPKDKTTPADLDRVIATIKKYRNTCDSVHFADNDLLVDRNVVVALCNKIVKAGLQDIPKVCKSRTDEVDPEILSLLRKAGFVIITYGVESFDKDVLDSIQKGTTPGHNERALEMTLAAGIKPGMDMIFFSPWESVYSLVSSAERALNYVEKGAYLSVVPEMHIQMGDRFTKEETARIEFEDIYFASTKSVFRNPKRAVLSDDMEKLRKDVLEKRALLEDDVKKKYAATHSGYISFSVSSLLFCRALLEALWNDKLFHAPETIYAEKLAKIDVLIERTIRLESQRVIMMPEKKPGRNEEFKRALSSYSALLEAEKSGWLDREIPRWKILKDMKQWGPHKDTVGEHTLGLLEVLDKEGMLNDFDHPEDILITAFFHDFGKDPKFRNLPDNHAIEGARITQDILTDFGFVKKDAEKFAWYVKHHDVFGYLARVGSLNDKIEDENIRSFLEKITTRDVDILTLLCLAEQVQIHGKEGKIPRPDRKTVLDISNRLKEITRESNPGNREEKIKLFLVYLTEMIDFKRRLSADETGNLERSIIMIKPDAVGGGYTADIVQSLIRRLNKEGLHFRIVAGKILVPSESQVRVLYDPKGRYFGSSSDMRGILGYLTSRHPNPIFPKAPVVVMIIEGEKGLIDTIGRLDVKGPGAPSVTLAGKKEEMRKRSIRYEFTVGKGHPGEVEGALTSMNAIHSDSSMRKSNIDIPAMYDVAELKNHWQDEALDKISSGWKSSGMKQAVLGGENIPEWSFTEILFWEKGAMTEKMLEGLKAKGIEFDADKADKLICDILRIQELLDVQERQFIEFMRKTTVDSSGIEALIFDLDNTLYKSPQLEEAYENLWIKLLAEKRHVSVARAKKLYAERQKKLGITSYWRTWQSWGYEKIHIMDAFIQRYDLSEYIRPDKNLEDLLKQLSSRYRLFVATGSSDKWTDEALESLGVRKYFEKVFTRENVGVEKNDSDYWGIVLNMIGNIPAHKVIVIGDDEKKDILSAESKGMRGLLVKGPEDLLDKLPAALSSTNSVSAEKRKEQLSVINFSSRLKENITDDEMTDTIKKTAQEDHDNLTVLQLDLLHTALHDDRIYTIKYDDSRLTDSQKEIIKLYVELLKKRSSAKIILQKHSILHGSKESLLAVYCSAENFKGEGHIDVTIPEGELKDYFLRITAMINMALASANIPDNLSEEDVVKYMPLISYIKDQYRSILGQELAVSGLPDDILKVIRNIVLRLPKSMRIELKNMEDYNRISKELLEAA